MKAFLSHKYADNPPLNKQRVDIIARHLYKTYGDLVISPLHAFSYLEDDTERQQVLDWCFEQIKTCDKFYVVKYKDTELSEGCKAELELAEKLGKEINYILRSC